MGEEDVVGEVKGVDSRAGGVGRHTLATTCSQFHKLRWKTPRGNTTFLIAGGALFY